MKKLRLLCSYMSPAPQTIHGVRFQAAASTAYLLGLAGIMVWAGMSSH